MEDLQADCWTGDEGLTLLELSPFGVIGAICPSTNPNETIVNNSIGMLAAGNAIVYAPHPGALQTSIYCVKLVNQAIAAAGGPANLVVTTANPTMESADKLMHHPLVRMMCATGGPGVVKAVLSSGKKAIGAGPGNPPALVDETADIEKAAKDIIDGCTFDNNLPCIAEKEVVVVDQVADYLIFNMKKNGAYEIKDKKASTIWRPWWRPTAAFPATMSARALNTSPRQPASTCRLTPVCSSANARLITRWFRLS